MRDVDGLDSKAKALSRVADGKQSATTKIKIEHAVLVERLKLFNSNFRSTFLVNVVFAAALVVALRDSAVPEMFLILWFCAVTFVTLSHRVVSHFASRHQDTDPQKWLAVTVVMGAVAGAMWGVPGLFLFYDLTATQATAVVMLTVCITAGACTTAFYLPFAIAFMGPALTPIAVHYFLGFGSVHQVMTVIVILYCIMLLTFSAKAAGAVTRMSQLAYKNNSLVTSLKRAVEDIRQREEKFRIIADFSFDGENWIDRNGKLIWTNPAIQRITGYSPDECYAMSSFPLDIVHEDDKATVNDGLKMAVGTESKKDLEFRIVRKDGSIRWCAVVSKPATDSKGHNLGFRASIRDISEMKSMQAELQRLASTDSLTGCLNRRAFIGIATSEFYRAKRYDSRFAIAMFDIDHFKRVNDTYGHNIGDECIRSLVKTVTGAVRGSDVFARFGGEEFILMLPETEAQDALRLCERLRKYIEETRIITDTAEIQFSVSIGVADFQHHLASLDEMVARADTALYTAKRNGRNQVAFASPLKTEGATVFAAAETAVAFTAA